MYKDKEKQKEASRERQRRYKAKQKALLEQGVTEGVTGSIDIETLVMVDAACGDKLTHGMVDLEKCRYCGKDLPKLQAPRRHPGACGPCAWQQPRKPQPPATEGHILSSRPALEFTGKMTAFEREHYKPASELGPGEHNPVSKPGDVHYG